MYMYRSLILLFRRMEMITEPKTCKTVIAFQLQEYNVMYVLKFTVTISKWRVIPMAMKVKVEPQKTLREQKSQRMRRELT